MLPYLFHGLILGLPLIRLTGIFWSYTAIIQWTFAVLIGFFIFLKKTNQACTAFAASFLSMHAAGLIYEIPFFLSVRISVIQFFFSNRYPLLLNTHFLSVAMLAWLLHDLHWKPNKIFWLMFSVFLTFSIIYFFFCNINPWIGYFARLPTIFLALSIPFTLRQNLRHH